MRKGSHLTDEQKIKISETCKRKGIKPINPFRWTNLNRPSPSKETKSKISETLKNKYRNGEIVCPIKGKHHSEETKRLLSEIVKKQWQINPIKRNKLTEETKKKISINRKGKCLGEKNHFYGKHFTEEHKQKLRIAKINNPSRYWLNKKRPDMSKKFKELWRSGKLNLRGENNYSWNGGSSFLPYDKNFNRIFKELIKLRDNNCLICGSNNKLSVHHIDYNKLNTIKENCLCLCNSCHPKTNFNRIHWITFFHSLLSEKYKYIYEDKIMEIKQNGTLL
jgi:hypothetical protein